MAAFHYRAVTPDGKTRAGSITAETERGAAAELRRQGLAPVYVGTEQQRSLDVGAKLTAWFTINRSRRRDVLFFTQELATLLNSGVALDRALAISTELTERADFRQILQDILRVLKGGKSLADSLATQPACFGSLYVNMVRAGEASGSLSQVFEQLAEFERTRDDLRNYIISSMVYPALLAFVGLGSIIVLLQFVVPRFASAFEQSRMAIPLPTQIMLEASKVVQTYGWMAGLALAAAAAVFQTYIRTAAGRYWWDGFRLGIPLLGDALRKAEVARFARAMSTLVRNSVPLVQSLGIARAILNNQRIAGTLDAVAQGVKRGEGIAAPLKRTKEFPALAGHLLTVGEETGKLDQMFGRMAEIYEADTRAAIRRFTSVFEPLVILIMGVVVGSLILSMLLAITSINEMAV
ncbi:MAG: type II secretion system F family protein [Acidobacteria bacterium]|nr:type II secretion system F family protein [Acidobacteriota bacterium]